MKKTLSLILVGILAIGIGAMSFADVITNPAEIYADLAGVTAAEAYVLKGTDKTFGDLAEENGFYEAFSEANLAGKTAVIAEMQASGALSDEDAQAILDQLEDCDGTATSRIGTWFNLHFGRSDSTVGTARSGRAGGSESAPRLGGGLNLSPLDGTGSRYGQMQ